METAKAVRINLSPVPVNPFPEEPPWLIMSYGKSIAYDLTPVIDLEGDPLFVKIKNSVHYDMSLYTVATKQQNLFGFTVDFN